MAKNVNYMQDAIKAAERHLPDNHRAILIVIPTNQPEPQIRYVSGVERESAVGILKNLLFRWGKNEEWMKHVE